MPYASSILQRKFGLGQQYDPDALKYFSTAGITAGNSTPTAYGTTNLVAYSQQIDNSSGWSGTNMTATGGQTDPLGGSTATLLSVNTGFAGANNYKNLPIPCVVTPSTIYTFSFYAKQGTQTGNNYAVYDPINSVFIVNATSYASQLNSSTYARVSVTFTTGSNQTQALVYLSSNSSSVGNWYVWGAQLETGSVATNYVPTTTSSATQVLSSASSRQLINSFVKGIKGLGLWSSMVCWPLRSSQNQSTAGTSVYSLGGLGSYTGTRVGASTWFSNGLNLSNNGAGTNNQYITISASLGTSGLNQFLMGVYKANSNTNFNQLIRIDDNTSTGKNPVITQNTDSNNNVQLYFPNSGGSISPPAFTSATSVGSFNALIGSKVGTSITVSLNSSGTLTATSTQSAFNLPSSVSNSALGYFTDGVMPFAMLGRFDASSTLVSQIYSLYKSTLGQGITLP